MYIYENEHELNADKLHDVVKFMLYCSGVAGLEASMNS